jgi:cytoskeletal protein RodZ
MALSMDEQRMLAEIEQRLAAQDPRLASDLSSFRKPGRLAVLRSTRARVIGSLFTVVVVAMVSLMVYAMLPFRSNARTTGNHPVTTSSTNSGPGQARIGAGPGTSSAAKASSATGNTSASAQAPATSKTSAHSASKPAVAQSGTSASAVRSP